MEKPSYLRLMMLKINILDGLTSLTKFGSGLTSKISPEYGKNFESKETIDYENNSKKEKIDISVPINQPYLKSLNNQNELKLLPGTFLPGESIAERNIEVSKNILF